MSTEPGEVQSVLSQICREAGKESLDPRWRILPAGSAANIPTFVSLVGPHLDVTVLADSDTKGMQRVTSMIDRELLAGHRLVFASAGKGSTHADIEDLFSEGDYLKLFNKTYGKSLKVSDLQPGDRIVKRIESHTEGSFIHGEVAETLLRSHHEVGLTATTVERFATLFAALNATLGT